MAGEQSVHEADFVHEKKTEGHADQPRRHSQSVVEPGEAIVRIGKRKNHRSGDEHHARNCSDSEYEQVRNRPFRIPDRRQNQQRNRRRTCEAVYQSNDERPRNLIHTHLAKMAIEPTERRLRRTVRMSFGIMPVRMSMDVIAVTVRMRMGGSR